MQYGYNDVNITSFGVPLKGVIVVIIEVMLFPLLPNVSSLLLLSCALCFPSIFVPSLAPYGLHSSSVLFEVMDVFFFLPYLTTFYYILLFINSRQVKRMMLLLDNSLICSIIQIEDRLITEWGSKQSASLSSLFNGLK